MLWLTNEGEVNRIRTFQVRAGNLRTPWKRPVDHLVNRPFLLSDAVDKAGADQTTAIAVPIVTPGAGKLLEPIK